MKISIKSIVYTNDTNTDIRAKRILNTIGKSVITDTDIIQYFNRYKNRYKPSTLSRDKAALKKLFLFNYEIQNKSIIEFYKLDRLFKSIKIKSYINKLNPDTVFSEKEINKLINKLLYENEKELAILLMFGQSTGLRPSEIINIKLSDCIKKSIKAINKNKITTIKYYIINIYANKTKTSYQSIVSEDLYQIVNNYFKGKVYLLENPNTKTQFKRNQYYRRIAKIKKYANKNIYPYLLRHGYATNYQNKGKDIVTASQLMGHSTSTHTKYYVHNQLNIKKILEVNQYNSIHKIKGVKRNESK
ncbi:MAG: site-specific integrase [Leptospiraceae bacterium]|nr:site-specific integrase [Leptospiraceae bacterium]